MKRSWLLPIVLLLNGYAEAQIHIVKVGQWLYLEYPANMGLRDALDQNMFWNEQVKDGPFVYCMDFDSSKFTFSDEAGAVSEYAISRTSSLDSMVECDYRSSTDMIYRTFKVFPSGEAGKFVAMICWSEVEADGNEKQCCMLSPEAERY